MNTTLDNNWEEITEEEFEKDLIKYEYKIVDECNCYDSIKKLTDRGLRQTNIHMMVSKETKDMVWETLYDYQMDPRLAKMNAIVFLSLKKKGRGTTHESLPQEEFEKIVRYALENKISIGFDSCGAGKFLDSVKDFPNYKQMYQMVEPCESLLTSFYIDVNGKGYSCSFCEDSDSFPEGIDIESCNDFLEDVWYNENAVEWRNHLLDVRKTGYLGCPVYEV